MTCTSAFESDPGSVRGSYRDRNMMASSGSNPEVRRPSKRGDSFVRDGYEITIEDIYHVNGRKKKKVYGSFSCLFHAGSSTRSVFMLVS